MKKYCIYLGGKISGLTLKEAGGWRHEFEEIFTSLGFDVFNPLASEEVFYEDDKPLPYIPPAGIADPFKKDVFAITHSDIIVINLLDEARAGTKGAISRGTYVEMGMAHALGKCIVLIFPEAIKIHPFLSGCADFVCNSLDEAIAAIDALRPESSSKYQEVNMFPEDPFKDWKKTEVTYAEA